MTRQGAFPVAPPLLHGVKESTISYLKYPFGLVVFFQIDVFFDPSGTFSPGQAIVEFEDDDILD